MNKDFKLIPKDKRKKILLICDDIRVHSGVATVAKEIVKETSHHFNWVQLAGAINHPDKGKKFDISESMNELVDHNESQVHLIPVNGYGDPALLRQVLSLEKPDAIMLFTDPRYFTWVFNMEDEIRKQIPIVYLNIWDDYPAPMYNRPYYESCDLLMGISKQTVNINKLVLEGYEKNKLFKYLPHGKDENLFYPLQDESKEFVEFKNKLFNNKTPEFVVYFNSRNIRRKQIPDTMLAFKTFLDSLPDEKSKDCYLVLKTELVTDAGTDLPKVKEYLFGEKYSNNVKFVDSRLNDEQLNWLYNIADVQILLTSNEGMGININRSYSLGNTYYS